MGLDLSLGFHREGFGAGGVDVFEDTEAGFVRHELGQFSLGRIGVQLEGGEALFGETRIVAEERPVTCFDRELLLIETLR